MESQEKVSDSIIRKIQLLLHLGAHKTGHDGASNENEAAVAMAKAQELMVKYNLDMAVIGSANVEGGTVAQEEEKRERMKTSRSAMYKWQEELCATICEANFCWHWVSWVMEDMYISGGTNVKLKKPRRVKRHVILGRKANQIVAQMMYEYLVDTIENIIPFTGRDRLSSSANSWRIGCAERLVERIRHKMWEMKTKDTAASEAGSGCTALVVRDFTVSEYTKNYDAKWGEGAWARKLKRESEYDEEMHQEEEERKALLARETDEEREKREEEEFRQEQRYRKAEERRQKAEDRREANENLRRDWTAYGAGRKKGNDIGLDSQLKSSTTKGQLK